MPDLAHTVDESGAVTFATTGHTYRLRPMPRGRPSVRLALHGETLHVARLDLCDDHARRRFAGTVNGRAPAGAVDRELLALIDLWVDGDGPPTAAAGAGDVGDAACGRASQATRLVALVGELDVDLFRTPEGNGCATIAVGEHRETWPLAARGFKDWLARQFYLAEEKAPGNQALQDALGVLRGRALYEGREEAVHLRVAAHEGAIYLDLADAGWRVVEISPDGWRVCDRAPVRFRRARGMLPLPVPRLGGSLHDLRRFVHVRSDDDFRLLVAWLVQTLRPVGPYPVLALRGEQGSAKSTTARVLKRLSDPNIAPLRAEPRDPRDLMIAATNSWTVALDNLSYVPAWLSDALCRLSTGGGFATRELYSDDEERIFDAQRPVVLTGISDIVVRSDLLDRAMLVGLPRFDGADRLPETVFWTRFEAAWPALLGSLLTAVTRALRDSAGLQFEQLPRLADFVSWAAAAMPAVDSTPERFLRAYRMNRQETNDLPLEASPVIAPLRLFLAIAFTGAPSWSGTATELLDGIAGQVDDKTVRQKGWPANGRALADALRRLAPNLRASGVAVEFDQREPHTGRRLIVLRPVDEDCVTRVTPVTDAESAPAADASGDAGVTQGDDDDVVAAHAASPAGSGPTPESTVGDAGDAGDASGQWQSGRSPQHPSDAAAAACDDQQGASDEPAAATGGASEGWGMPDATAHQVLRTSREVAAALPQLLAAQALGFDTETTGLDPLSDRLRLIQLATADRVVVVDCFAVSPAALAPVFAQGPRFIGHNLRFDLRFLIATGLPVPAGDRLFDTMLASQLLHSGLPAPKGTHSLAGVVERVLGATVDKSEQRSDWSGTLSEPQLVYAARDAAVLLPLAARLEADLIAAGLGEVAALEQRALPAIAWLEHSGAPFEAEAWAVLSDAAADEQLRLEEALTALAGTADLFGHSTVNWDSPDQLVKLLRQRGHPLTRTDEATLQALAPDEPLAALLLRYREASRKSSSYGIEFAAQVHARTGRLHADYSQIGASSGRMACSRPNLQNIPRDPAYRACFRPGAGRCLVKADYSQIELRIAAQVSRDSVLLAAYREGADVHLRTAAAVLGVAEAAVTKPQRQLAKALNFGLLYGMGAPRLREYAGTTYGVALTERQAQTFRERFFRTYPGLRRWHRGQPDGAVETRTLSGRRRLGVERFTDKLNLPVQGTGADILKLALARLWEDRASQPSAMPVLCVHDEIVLECDADRAEEVATWLQHHMEAAGAALLPDVSVVADVTIAADWSGTPLHENGEAQ